MRLDALDDEREPLLDRSTRVRTRPLQPRRAPLRRMNETAGGSATCVRSDLSTVFVLAYFYTRQRPFLPRMCCQGVVSTQRYKSC